MLLINYTCLFLFAFSLMSCNERQTQDSLSGYSYLIDCFKDGVKDSTDIEIGEIGRVRFYSILAKNEADPGLEYFDIPIDKLNENPKVLAQSVANWHIETWKNNSAIVMNKSIMLDKKCLGVDLRLHLIIENIFLQELIIYDNKKIYEVTNFSETEDLKSFDILTEEMMNQNCP